MVFIGADRQGSAAAGSWSRDTQFGARVLEFFTSLIGDTPAARTTGTTLHLPASVQSSRDLTEMIEDLRRNELHGVERSAGHLEEPDVQSERQPVQGAAPFANRGKFTLVEREEVLDLRYFSELAGRLRS